MNLVKNISYKRTDLAMEGVLNNKLFYVTKFKIKRFEMWFK